MARRIKIPIHALALLGFVIVPGSWAGAAADLAPAGLGMDEIVVTASVSDGTKMQQSLSVSTLSGSQIADTVAANSAEALRVIPGLHVESSGGEGNANLTVRGVPISAGGARYVQWQEDGLPVLHFGDIAFATADQFVRLDSGLERIEVVRGGSASTQATGAPGGVINLIARTGREDYTSLGVSQAVNFNQQKYTVDSGRTLDNGSTRYSFAGFYRRGESPREAGITLEQGGQVKFNLTQEFNQGYVRVNAKYLNDQVPMFLPVPVTLNNGHIETLPGMDPRRANLYSPYWGQDESTNANNQTELHSVNNGLQINSKSVGAEVGFTFAGGWEWLDKLRISENTGRFIGLFPADNNYTAAVFPLNNSPFFYASGPSTGQSYNGPVITVAAFNVALNDLGNRQNDLTLKKDITLNDGDSAHLAAGLYTAQQNVDLTWHFNHYLLTREAYQPALISSPNTASTTPGLLAYGTDVWGGCCSRDINAQYTTIAPYLSLGWQSQAWNIEASVRHDNQNASGYFNSAVNQRYNKNDRQSIDYAVHEMSYSLGVNYRISDDLALFARQSKGSAFNADRIMFNGFALDGSSAIPINQLTQTEGGIKWQSDDTWEAFLTLFNALTDESNYEATTQTFTQRHYTGRGLELELAWHRGAWSIRSGLTYTDATIDQAEILGLNGKMPRRQASWVYQVSPVYSSGKNELGGSIIGTSEAWGDDANTIHLPAYAVLNLFARHHLTPAIDINLSANNILDQLAYTEVEGDGHAARALNGRTVILGLRYQF